MASSASTLIILFIAIAGSFAVFPQVFGPESDMIRLNNQLNSSLTSLGNSVSNLQTSSSVVVFGVNVVLAAGNTFNVLKNMFLVVPTTAVNALAIPVVGAILGSIVFFIMAMSVLNWLMARGEKP